MLSPRRVKRRKVMRGRLKGKATRGNFVSNGEFGLQALDASWITANQIEAARIAMTRYIKRGGKVWIKIFPDKPITEKPAETRMGSGKGSPEYWVAVVKPGRVMFELAGVSEEVAREALRLAANKLPVRCKFIKRDSDGPIDLGKKMQAKMSTPVSKAAPLAEVPAEIPAEEPTAEQPTAGPETAGETE